MPPSSKVGPELAIELASLYTHPTEPKTQSELAQYCADRGIDISLRTIGTILREHNAKRYNDKIDTPELRVRIAELYFQECLPDTAIHETLQDEGYKIAYWTFVQLRRSIGIKKKHSVAEYEARYEEFKQVVARELDKGEITSYGRTMLHTYFRSEPSIQMLISRYVL